LKRLQAHGIRLPRLQPGFSLVEMTIVLLIVSILMGGMMAMLSTQVDQRNWNDTQSRLEAARDAILGYAISNGRLPCPANSTSAGAEVVQVSGVCGAAGTTQDYYGGVVGGVTYGLMPAVTVGYLPVDTQGFALDGWGNRIRYRVSKVTTPSFSANFTNRTNLKANGISTLPNDLVVCASAAGTLPAASPPSCGTATSVTSKNTVVAILQSMGKNGRALGLDEIENENPAGTNNAVFISHPPAPATTPINNEFDDQVLWISVGTLYGRLISAGLLP
jgi:prepilin-type N-terminal cleavage/methylation domain-containing protein